MLAPQCQLRAAEAEEAGDTITIPLNWQEVNYSFLNLGLSSTIASEPFPQEPESTGTIYRGTLDIGGDRTNVIAFLWQRSAGKLFLDLNGNRDLTDDDAGRFSPGDSKPGRYQTFSGVHVPLMTPAGVITQLVDLHFWDYSGRPNASAALRTFWQGRVELNGTAWQVGVPQKFSNFQQNYLLFRPWDRRDKPFNVQQGGSLEALSFPRQIFVGGQLYRCEFKAPSPESHTAQLQLTRQEATLGELQIAGEFIQRLVLQNNDKLVLLDRPDRTVQVPVGSYTDTKVWLQAGGVDAFREFQRTPSASNLIIATNPSATLTAGGPLTNSVSVTRHGGTLVLSYELIGADGQKYELAAARDYSKPPQFVVFSGEKQIDSGKFEFG